MRVCTLKKLALKAFLQKCYFTCNQVFVSPKYNQVFVVPKPNQSMTKTINNDTKKGENKCHVRDRNPRLRGASPGYEPPSQKTVLASYALWQFIMHALRPQKAAWKAHVSHLLRAHCGRSSDLCRVTIKTARSGRAEKCRLSLPNVQDS